MAQRILFGFWVVLTIFCEQPCYAQNSVVDSLFARFREDILAEMYMHNGRIVWDNETRESYYTLLSICTAEDLLRYVDDSVPAVRAKIFSGLAEKTTDNMLLRNITDRHKNDTIEVTYAITDVVVERSVIGYMEEYVNWHANKQVKYRDWGKLAANARKERFTLIRGAHHGIIHKDTLLVTNSLQSPIGRLRIISFTLSTLAADGSVDEFRSEDDRLTSQMKARLSRLWSGDRLFIDEIKALDTTDGAVRILMSGVFRVK